jgi:hypothetical protein
MSLCRIVHKVCTLNICWKVTRHHFDIFIELWLTFLRRTHVHPTKKHMLTSINTTVTIVTISLWHIVLPSLLRSFFLYNYYISSDPVALLFLLQAGFDVYCRHFSSPTSKLEWNELQHGTCSCGFWSLSTPCPMYIPSQHVLLHIIFHHGTRY